MSSANVYDDTERAQAYATLGFPGTYHLLRELRRLLSPRGRIVLLASSAEIYTHEWASFTTRDFPENRHAKSGDRVRIVMKDVEDRRLRDEADNHLVELAVAGSAAAIVTKNTRDFRRTELQFPDVRVLKPEELLKEVRAWEP